MAESPLDHSNEQSENAVSVDAIESAVIQMVHQLITELRPQSSNALHVTLDSALERDLGLDSLDRKSTRSELQSLREIAVAVFGL